MEKRTAKVVVGSKDAVLTAEAVYNVAHRLSSVEVDVSGVTPPKRKESPAVISGIQDLRLQSDPNGTDSNHDEEQGFFTDEEVRATLIVILHKLLIGRLCSRTFLPVFICRLLNGDRTFGKVPASQGNGVARVLVEEVYSSRNDAEATGNVPLDVEAQSLKGQSQSLGLQVSDFGLTLDEVDALLNLANIGVLTGGAALVSYELFSLVVLADAAAAMSYEALQADTAFLDSPYFKQAHTSKTEAAVASDLCALLSGSKLTKPGKGIGAPLVRCVASVHGALRDAAKSLASGLTVEINREEFLSQNRQSSSRLSSAEEFSTSQASMLSVLVCLRSSSRAGLDRMQMIYEDICDIGKVTDPVKSRWEEEYEDENMALNAGVRRSLKVVSGVQRALLSRFTLAAVGTWNGIIAKEFAAALSLLSIRENMTLGGEARASERQTQSREPGEVTAPSRRTKKTFVLGKGTDIVRETLRSNLASGLNENIDSPWFLFSKEQLYKDLNPGAQGCLDVVAKVKVVKESNEVGRLPKIAKGTRDFKPEQMVIRERAFGIITSIFKRHGAGALDTPVFELRETLMGKYGEDSKLIYDLADQGGELLSLRYDLTVPFARYLAMNNQENMKRYHIAKVYRRDNPSKGRFREFYQCDLDIAGQYASMVPDFEILKVVTEVLDELGIGEYEVKLNHRQLLDGMLDVCGVPQAKFRSICSAIDKLDKLPWENVRQEMVEEKGLTAETADKIGQLVQRRGSPPALLEELKRPGSPFLEHEGSCNALTELELLVKYLRAARCLDRIILDLSLARGLDYYTGVIYEAVFKGSQQVGSIAAGGRYDDLVGVFRNKKVPAVGVSIGIERVFTIMAKLEEDRKQPSQLDVLVVVLGNDVQSTEHAIGIVTDLWEGKITAEFKCVRGSKLTQQILHAEKTGIPWLVVAGEDEINAGKVTLKSIASRKQDEIRREDLVIEMRRRLEAAPIVPGFSSV